MKNMIINYVQKGFILIELMIVVVIIGILVVVVILQYQDYIVCFQVIWVVGEVNVLKLNVESIFNSGGQIGLIDDLIINLCIILIGWIGFNLVNGNLVIVNLVVVNVFWVVIMGIDVFNVVVGVVIIVICVIDGSYSCQIINGLIVNGWKDLYVFVGCLYS